MLDLRTFCKKIEPFVVYYKRLIKSYNNTTHKILENEINLLLPQTPRKQKCGINTMLVSSLIGLAYEGISSFLHHSRAEPSIRQLMPWIVKLILIRLLSLFVYIMNKTGTAVNKVKSLLKS